MRELKFRGFSKSLGLFVFGAFIDCSDENCLNLPAFFRRELDGDIEAETISQYTGLNDKNGVEIYEGDIVALEEEDEDSCIGATFDYKCVVSYGNSLKISRYVAQYPSSFCVISKSFYMEQALLHNPKWQVKVIGNIYENADLLK